MADTVSPSGGQPLYYSKEFAFTKMSVDRVFNYTVLYLYNPGTRANAFWLFENYGGFVAYWLGGRTDD